MALSGMTGFARAQGAAVGWSWTWELKSVNGKGLDVRAKTPVGFDTIEPFIRPAVAKRIARGSISANLRAARDLTHAQPHVDLAYITALVNSAKPLLRAGTISKPRLDGLLNIKGVIAADDDLSE